MIQPDTALTRLYRNCPCICVSPSLCRLLGCDSSRAGQCSVVISRAQPGTFVGLSKCLLDGWMHGSPTNLNRVPANVIRTGSGLSSASTCVWSESCYSRPVFTCILKIFSWEKAISMFGFQSSLFTEVATAVNGWRSPPWWDCHRHCPGLAKWLLFVDSYPLHSWGHPPLAFLGRSGVGTYSPRAAWLC